MTNQVAGTQEGDSHPLRKPTEWGFFMATAAVKVISNDTLAARHLTHDEGRLEILNRLNWYEAHDEYKWPEFTKMGFDFTQAMRFRRALVNDVLDALEKAGNIQACPDAFDLDTSSMSGESRGTKRFRIRSSNRTSTGKRLCTRKQASDTTTDSDNKKRTLSINKDKPFDNTRRLTDMFEALCFSHASDSVTAWSIARSIHEQFVSLIKDGASSGDQAQSELHDTFAPHLSSGQDPVLSSAGITSGGSSSSTNKRASLRDTYTPISTPVTRIPTRPTKTSIVLDSYLDEEIRNDRTSKM